jgi:NitT/TauT family transport system permease protein
MGGNDERHGGPNSPQPANPGATGNPSGASANSPARATDATAPRGGVLQRLMGDWFVLRNRPPQWQAILLGLACVAICYLLWWWVTRGPDQERIVRWYALPSPEETFRHLESLWFDFALLRNTLVTLKRVALGFGLAILVGVPLGVLAGCYPRLSAFLLPVVMFGRNIPLAAVIPLMFFFFGIGEQQKMMFIFVACIAFIVSDTARAISDVAERYIDTAYTLGASPWNVIFKVLVPLAMPAVFDSLRLLFGLAFGYIMLAETITASDELPGLGFQIQIFQRRGPRENIYLIILIIPLVALAIDRLLFWCQRQLFPHLYGSDGILNYTLRGVLHGWDGVKGFVFPPKLPPHLETALENPSKSAGATS